MAAGWKWLCAGTASVLALAAFASALVSACASEQKQTFGPDDAGDDQVVIVIDAGTDVVEGGVCPNNQCAPHFADCNHNASDGCEANLRANKNNCGSCGHVCGDAGTDGGPLPPQAVPFCTDGGCDWFCAPVPNVGEIYKRCGDNCVSFVCDPMNCGDCNVVCPMDNLGNRVCSTGNCGCPFGTVDCDGVPECGYECKDLNADPQNCGQCGRRCPQDPALPPFHMANTCNGPNPDGGLPDCVKTCIRRRGDLWLDCNGDSQQAPDAGDGCETPGWGSTTNCGACGNACKVGDVCHPLNATTTDQECGCPNGLTYCPTVPYCRNLQTDPYNCGACGHTCPIPPHARPTCVAGQCGYECQFGFADCNKKQFDGCEIDILNNPDNCGGCTNDCDAGTIGCGAHCQKNSQDQYIQRCQNGVCATQGCNIQ